MKSLETLVFVLLALATVPAVVFPFAYAWIARGVWWRTPTGRALMISSTALASLLLSEVVFGLVPIAYPAELGLVLAIVFLIMCGAWLKLGALLHEARRARKAK